MTAQPTKRPRYALLDTLRGFALVNMVAYHGLWDLIYLAGFTPGWYSEGGAFYWQQGICWTFILLSGFCWGMSRHPVRHGVVVFACGLLVTAVTALVEPTALIWWGVLSLLGAAGLLLTVQTALLLVTQTQPLPAWALVPLPLFLLLWELLPRRGAAPVDFRVLAALLVLSVLLSQFGCFRFHRLANLLFVLGGFAIAFAGECLAARRTGAAG
ncbi:MAG: DUF1624 domain-containing protein [Clostridiales bacterium]|nr:DUF1624 domain-containing protein [Clostridiales bacterium]